jgi:ribosomal protein S15P/S13E
VRWPTAPSSAMPKRVFLAFHVAAGLQWRSRLVDARAREQRVARLLAQRVADGQQQHDEHDRHRGQHRPALARVADHLAEGVAQRRRDQQDRQHLQEVGQRRRVLERMRRVGVEEAAAVGAELLDRLLRGDRPIGSVCLSVLRVFHHRVALVVLERLAVGAVLGLLVLDLERRHVLVGVEVLHHALADQNSAARATAAAGCRASCGSGRPRSCRSSCDAVAREAADQRDHDAMPVAAETKFCTVSASICVR